MLLVFTGMRLRFLKKATVPAICPIPMNSRGSPSSYQPRVGALPSYTTGLANLLCAMKRRIATLERIRSKLLRVRGLSSTWIRMGEDYEEIVFALMRFNHLLRQKQLSAGEGELDSLILRLRQRTAFQSSDRSAA